MKKKTYLKRIVIYLILLIVIALATVYIWSAVILNKTYDIPLSEVHIPNDTASIQEGERLVHIAHCSDCHGEHFTGAVFAKEAHVVELVAPNITRVIPTYSNAELERLLRHGVKKNGHSVYEMPADMFSQLKEESIGKMIAYFRTLRPLPDTLHNVATNFQCLGRLILIQGKITPIADLIKFNAPRLYIPHDTSQISFGKYLAMTTCTSCHGENLKGEEEFTPDLVIAATYTKEDFFKLIRTGVALGDRKLGLMTKIATNNLKYLNDNEINSIYAYLKTKPTR